MFDLSAKFNDFYKNNVLLSREEQNKLLEKGKLNIERIENGLIEYNEEHNTNYKIIDSCIQGSVAMHTVVQNEENDYDIDIAIVFDEENLNGKGPEAVRNIVADALRRKAMNFNTKPEVKTSCVRVKYEEGYHIDYAIFKRKFDLYSHSYSYEHAGASWNVRGLKSINEWFDNRNRETDDNLRKVVRLSKMFCRSKESWKNMPSGLIQTVLCYENLDNQHTRIDEVFYYTMKNIVNRLKVNTIVNAPEENRRCLTNRVSDQKRIINWRNRLESKLEDLNRLFEYNCEENDALQAWYGFFNNDFWMEKLALNDSFLKTSKYKSVKEFKDTEEFIEDKYECDFTCTCSIESKASGNGFMTSLLSEFLKKIGNHVLPHKMKVECTMKYTDCDEPYKVLWKVRNVGPEAERLNMIRGQILDRGNTIVEPTSFYGEHYIECYIIKNNKCVAKKRVSVPIGRR